MKKLFVPYDLALALKEVGFDEPCIGIYSGEKIITAGSDAVFKRSHEYYREHGAILYDQVLDWLDEKHHLQIEIGPNRSVIVTHLDDKVFWYKEECGIDLYSFNHDHLTTPGGDELFFASRKEALIAGIKHCIKLIKERNEKPKTSNSAVGPS